MRRMMFALIFAATTPAFADQSFHEYADGVVDQIWQDLAQCGLQRLDAYDPRLPLPQVPADEAVVTIDGQVLAYTYLRQEFGAFVYEFKAWNGGFPHRIALSENRLRFITPYGGTVARASEFFSPGMRHVNLWCRSTRVPILGFEACVRTNFVNIVVAQLCGF